MPTTPTVIEINDYIGPNGFEEWGYITPTTIKTQLKEAKDDIRIDINSGGGSVFSAWEIINALNSYDKGSITTRITGMAASAAGMIFLMSDNREVYNKSYFMAHPARTFFLGTQYEMESELQLMKKIDEITAQDIHALTNEDIDKVREKIRNDYNLVGKDILNSGIATKMITGQANIPAEPDNKLQGKDKEKLENALRNQKIDKNLHVARLHAKDIPNMDVTTRIAASIKPQTLVTNQTHLSNSNVIGGKPEMTEEEIKALFVEREVHDKAIKDLETKHQENLKNERSRIANILSVAPNMEAAEKAVEDGLTEGEFAFQQLKNAKAEKESWKDIPKPTDQDGSKEDILASIGGPLKDTPISGSNPVISNLSVFGG